MAQGQTVRSGETLCYLTEQPGEIPPKPALTPIVRDEWQKQRITQPALALAVQLGIDLSRLPADLLVTESVVRDLAKSLNEVAPLDFSSFPSDPSSVIIYGGGGHGKSLIDLIRLLQVYRIVGVIDDGLQPGEQILDVPVLGGFIALGDLRAQGVHLAVNAVGGIGNIAVRIDVFQRLMAAGFTCPAVVHPASWVEASASLADGVQVFAHAYVGSGVRVGYGCIVNTAAVVSHDCILEEYANISPGALLAGDVKIGAAALIGMGATINLGVRVGAGARIGNSAAVKEDVPEKGIVRAGATWP